MQVDKCIFFSCVALIAVSAVFSLSLPVFTVLYFNYEPYHFFVRQLVVGVIGIFLMWGISRLDPDKSLVWIGFCLFGFCAIAMGAMHALPSSLVTDAGGAKRWIRLPGFSLAPVEFFKIGFVYFLAWSFTRKIDGTKKSLKEEFGLILPYLFLFLVAVYLIAILQNDLGQVVVLALTLAVMMFFAGTSFRLFAIGIGLAVMLASIAIVTSEHDTKYGLIHLARRDGCGLARRGYGRSVSDFALAKCDKARRIFRRGAGRGRV